MRKIIVLTILILMIGIANAAYVNDEAFGLGNGAYITLNQTTFDNLTCCSSNTLFMNVSGSALSFTAGANKTITNPTYVSDNYTFTASGIAGYLNFTATMLNASSSYSLTANGVFVESRNTTTENVVWFNYTGDAILSVAWDTPPTSITGLTNTTGNFWHNWTWTNPADADFNHTLIYINGNFVISQSATFYNFTASAHNSSTISIRTVDTAENVNQTWVNHTSKIPNNVPIQSAIGDKTVNEGSLLSFSITGFDADSDSFTCTSNNTKGTLALCGYSWTPGYTDSGNYTFIYYLNDSYGGSDSEVIKITVIDTKQTVLTTWWNSITGDDRLTAHPEGTESAEFRLGLNTITTAAWTYDGVVQSETSPNFTVSLKSLGVHTLSAYGNVPTGVTQTVTWKLLSVRERSGVGNVVDELNTTWFNDLTDSMNGSSPDFTVFVSATVAPYTAQMGALFYVFIYLLPLVIIWIRQEKVLIPAGLLGIFGLLLIPMLPAEWRLLAGLCVILTSFGVVYSLFKERG